MRTTTPIVALVALVFGVVGVAAGNDLGELKVLYIGDVGTPRAGAFTEFLRPKVGQLQTVSRAAFKPDQAAGFDVVVLDWPQEITRFVNGKVDFGKPTSPLGAREAWSKPTVLLGSAGLNLAVAWEVHGGVGCTCLYPYAYGLRDHVIFREPSPIATDRLVPVIGTAAFRLELGSLTTPMLPLVDKEPLGLPGWCTYSNGFENNPEIEIFCGGKNDKTPTAAACWRQGHLLHFGFEQSPGEMNENGRALLLNCIAYISRFTEDRPIAVTPSAFTGAVRERGVLDRLLAHPDPENRLDWYLTPEFAAELKDKSADDRRAWLARHRSYLRPGAEQKLEVDRKALELAAPIDQPEFFEKAIATMREGGQQGRTARTLLDRYAPVETTTLASVDDWSKWLEENRNYLFYSDRGDYRWYIDPLAKRRGIPSKDLRGPARATLR